MQIRTAAGGDVEGIQRVARDAWEAAYLDIIGQQEVDAAMNQWYSREFLETAIRNEDVGYFVAVDEQSSSAHRMESADVGEQSSSARQTQSGDVEDGEIVGYASGGPTDEVGVGALLSIYVLPDRWDDGIGGNLLDAVDRHLDGLGMARIRAVVIAENEVGNAFYRARGFEQIEEREADLLAGTTVAENVYYREIE